MNEMWFKALLDVSVDLEKLWKKISVYNRVNLGGEDGRYAVYFTGSRKDGLDVLDEILIAGHCDIHLTSNI